MAAKSSRVQSGIPGIDKIPWGSHICQWYTHREDLVRSLIPYFQTGLLNNERCIWITAEPYGSADAEVDLAHAMPALNGGLHERAQIRNYDDWHGKREKPNIDEVLDYWLNEEARALADGYHGLRIAVNTSFVSPAEWNAFFTYEKTVVKALKGHRIIALCNYSLLKTTGTDIFEAVKSHQYTIYRRDNDWTILEV